jgi:hypothetical protein
MLYYDLINETLLAMKKIETMNQANPGAPPSFWPVGRVELICAIQLTFMLMYDKKFGTSHKNLLVEYLRVCFRVLYVKTEYADFSLLGDYIFSVRQCLACPEQVAIAMKTLSDSTKLFRQNIESEFVGLMRQLVMIYFTYYILVEYRIQKDSAPPVRSSFRIQYFRNSSQYGIKLILNSPRSSRKF